MTGSATPRTMIVLLAALLSGALAGYAALLLLTRRTTELPATRTILTITGEARGFALGLDDRRVLFVDTSAVPSNARNIALIYPGKKVAVVNDGASDRWPSARPGCEWIVPLFQEDPREITLREYERLRSLGFSRKDLAYSYAIPTGVPDSDSASVPGGLVYPGLSLCATR